MKINQVKVGLAKVKASQVLDYCGVEFANQLGLYEILYGRGIDMILSKNIFGSEARISFRNNKSIVTLNEKNKNEAKRNFTLAHELAHFEIHKNILQSVHIDDANSLNSWFTGGHHEIEANCFAAELLMPKKSFIKYLPTDEFSIESIRKLSNIFNSSLTSTAIQFKEYGNYPICLISSQNGLIKWSCCSDDFPLKFIPNGNKISVNSVAGELYNNSIVYQEPQIINCSVWFSEDREYPEFSNILFYEQCIKLSNNSILSLIWME